MTTPKDTNDQLDVNELLAKLEAFITSWTLLSSHSNCRNFSFTKRLNVI